MAASGVASIPAAAGTDLGTSTLVSATGASHHISVGEYAPSSSPYAALNRYVYVSKAGYTVKAPRAVLQGLPRASTGQLQSYLTTANGYVAAGRIAINANGVGTAASAVAPTRALSPQSAPRWKGKHGYIEVHWYGLKVALDAYATNKVEGGAWIGAGSAALIAALGGGPYAAAVAAALTIAAGAVQFCQHSSGWTYLYFLDWPAPGFVCNPFG